MSNQANAAIFIKWGAPVLGRETKSIEVFKQGQEYWGHLQKEGKVSAFRTYITTNGNRFQFGGFIVLEGEVSQLRAVLDSPEHKQLIAKAQQVVSHAEIVHCVTGTEIQKALEEVVNARKQLGITT
jgi:hypothetical protein